MTLDELANEIKECILPIIGDITALTFVSSVQEQNVLAVIHRFLSNTSSTSSGMDDSATQLLTHLYSNHLIHLQQRAQTAAELIGEAKKVMNRLFVDTFFVISVSHANHYSIQIFEIEEYLTKCHESAKSITVHSSAPALIHLLDEIKLAAKLVQIPSNSTNYWSCVEFMQTKLFEIGWKDPVIRGQLSVEIVKQFASLAASVIDGDDLASAEHASAFFQSLLQHTLSVGASTSTGELVSLAMGFCHKNSALNRKDSAVKSMRFLSVMIDFSAQNEEQFRTCSECGVMDELFRLCRGAPPPSVEVYWNDMALYGLHLHSLFMLWGFFSVQACAFEKDILVQITAIELLQSVASTLGGLGYLCSQGMVEWLVDASSAEADPFISGEVRAILISLLL
jgi:hypothetical protein